MYYRSNATLNKSKTRCELYRYFTIDGELLYIGITVDPPVRDRTHRRKAEWYELVSYRSSEWYDTIYLAEDAERIAIKTERPVFNIKENR